MRKELALGLVALISLWGAQACAETRTEVREFAPGGSLRIALPVGDLHISKGTDPHHIVVRYTPDPHKPDAAQRAHLRFEVQGAHAEIEFNAPRNVSIDTEIEVPGRTDLQVNMSVGDLTVEGVQGDKNLQTHVGDVKVDLGADIDLLNAEASTQIGDLDAPPVGTMHGWLGHTWRYRGDGRYLLHVHTDIGDVDLSSKQGSETGSL